MKKIIVVLSATLICCVYFVGCNTIKEVTTTQESLSETKISEDTTQTQVSMSTEDLKDDSDYIFGVLEDIMIIYPGTAGCSLRSATVAGNCMKVADKIELNKDKIVMDIYLYSNNLSDEERETFIESINTVTAMLNDFINDWDNSKAILADAGTEKDFKDYVPNKDKIQPLYDALKDFTLEKGIE